MTGIILLIEDAPEIMSFQPLSANKQSVFVNR